MFKKILFTILCVMVVLQSTCSYAGFVFGCEKVVAADYVPATAEIYVQNGQSGSTKARIILYDSSRNLLFSTDDSGALTDDAVNSLSFSSATALTPTSDYYITIAQDYYLDLYSQSTTTNLKGYSNSFSTDDDPLEAGVDLNKKSFQVKIKNAAGDVLLGVSGSFVTTHGYDGWGDYPYYIFRETAYTCNTL